MLLCVWHENGSNSCGVLCGQGAVSLVGGLVCGWQCLGQPGARKRKGDRGHCRPYCDIVKSRHLTPHAPVTDEALMDSLPPAQTWCLVPVPSWLQTPTCLSLQTCQVAKAGMSLVRLPSMTQAAPVEKEEGRKEVTSLQHLSPLPPSVCGRRYLFEPQKNVDIVTPSEKNCMQWPIVCGDRRKENGQKATPWAWKTRWWQAGRQWQSPSELDRTVGRQAFPNTTLLLFYDEQVWKLWRRIIAVFPGILYMKKTLTSNCWRRTEG